MRTGSFDAIIRVLNAAGVEFIVVGGLAVVAHGYGRLTHDVDLVIRLDPESVAKAFVALESLGFRPRVPVTAEGFGDAAQRARWVEEKGMTVLNFHSDEHRDTPVDIFVTEPFDFDEEYRHALVVEAAPGVDLRILRLESLVGMKVAAGRPQDLADIAELRLLHGE